MLRLGLRFLLAVGSRVGVLAAVAPNWFGGD